MRNISPLRFTTAGSVDDGKSTLIGRLLLDAKGLLEDQLAAVARTTARRGDSGLDLSLFTDGLTLEREQGITIDVAYRYFATPTRRFIIADTPGHEQYTRNMVTGSSTADLSVILGDATHGPSEQTRRHAAVAAPPALSRAALVALARRRARRAARLSRPHRVGHRHRRRHDRRVAARARGEGERHHHARRLAADRIRGPLGHRGARPADRHRA